MPLKELKPDNNKIKAHFLSNREGSKYKVKDFEGSCKVLIEAIRLDSTNFSDLNNLPIVCNEVCKPGG